MRCTGSLLGLSLLSAVAAGEPPGLWFWGSASPESLGAIKSFQGSLKAKAPTVYYSFGGLSVGAGGQFQGSQNATLIKEMKGMGIKVYATVGATNITTLRSIFKEPQPYIEAAVKSAVASGIDGYNLDWEPYVKGMTKWTPGDEGDVDNSDGLAYARFVDTFAKALHKEQKQLSLDFFTDLAIWNLAALNSTAVDTVISMDTCEWLCTAPHWLTGVGAAWGLLSIDSHRTNIHICAADVQDNQTEQAYVQMATTYVNAARLGVGVCPGTEANPTPSKPPLQPYGPDSCGTAPYTPELVDERLAYFKQLLATPRTSFRMMNMCCSGLLSEVWWSGLRGFYSSM